MCYYALMKKEIKSDVLVIGGGIAGVAAAYISAKNNLDTILIEKNNYLGGLVTGGLVVPSMKVNSEGINEEFFNDLVGYSNKINAQITYGDGNMGWFNPVLLKIVFEKMLKDAGCKIIYEKMPLFFKKYGQNITSVEFDEFNISSKYYIDSTGNGSFSKLLGCDFIEDKDKKQLPSLRFIMSGVNLKKLSDFLLETDKDRSVTASYTINGEIHLSTACTSSGNWALRPLFEKAVKENVLKESDTDYFQIFTIAGMKNSVAFNCPRLKEEQKDIYSYSNSIIEGRSAIYRLQNFCKKYLKGFENSYISNISDIVGKREDGRVKTKYIYTTKDIRGGKKYKNTALCSNYPIDVHSKKQEKSKLERVGKYYLPLESLMSFNYENLYIIGKCLGAEFEAQAALRVQQSCASMGEAAARDIRLKI